MPEGDKSEDWRVLCEKASHEEDNEKLLELLRRLHKALDERQPQCIRPNTLQD
jgi:hypothetical protein